MFLGLHTGCNMGYTWEWKGNHYKHISNLPETMLRESRLHPIFPDFLLTQKGNMKYGNKLFPNLLVWTRFAKQMSVGHQDESLDTSWQRHFLQWFRFHCRQKSFDFHHSLAKQDCKAGLHPSVRLKRQLAFHRSSGILGKTSSSHTCQTWHSIRNWDV